MAEIQKLSGFARSTITWIRDVAYQRGYNPDTNFILDDQLFEDASRSGRPTAMRKEKQNQVLEQVKKNRSGQKMLTYDLAAEFCVSARTIHRILRKKNIRKLKPTWKPGLIPAMKAVRLQFALDHKD